MKPENLARAAKLHRRMADICDELSDLYAAGIDIESPSDEPVQTVSPPPVRPPSELDVAAVKRLLLRKGYRVSR